MQPDTFTLDFVNGRITVLFMDGSEKVYTDAGSYLADFPDRRNDAIAMGWVTDA